MSTTSRATSSGIDRLLAAAGVDPADGVQAVAAARLAAIAFDPSLPLVLLAGPPAAENKRAPRSPHRRRTVSLR